MRAINFSLRRLVDERISDNFPLHSAALPNPMYLIPNIVMLQRCCIRCNATVSGRQTKNVTSSVNTYKLPYRGGYLCLRRSKNMMSECL